MYPIRFRRLAQCLAVTISVLVLAGCGDGDGPERIPGTPQPKLVGLLIDAAVEGVEYQTSFGDMGITNAAGEFQYVAGEQVTFRIGDIELGTAPGAPIITPVELTNSVDPTSPAATNMAVFIQSLDADSDPSNGILITEAVRSNAAGMSLDFSSPDFDTLVVDAVTMLTGGGNMVISEAAALENFYEAYVGFGGTDSVSWQFPGFPPVGGGIAFELVFADEFNEGSAPSPEKWNIETGYGENNSGWGNNEWQLYTDSPDNVRVEDGNLVIQARCDEPCGVRDGTVTSARINTLDKFDFSYGRIVARIKVPVGEGSWPAFWSLGSNFPEIGWPRSGEIDYMEVFPSVSNDRTTHFAMHWCDETIQAPETCSFPEGRRFVSDQLTLAEPLGDDYHIFEADWNENRVIGKIDGTPYFSFAINPATMEEFRRDFFMILNVAMGGTLGSDNEPPSGNETWPQTMLVDYVRVFQQTSGGGPVEDTLIDFEDAPESYDFAGGGFEGGSSAVLNNPFPEGINTSAQVVRMQKFPGAVFGGSQLTLSEPAEITESGNVTMKVWSQRVVPVTFKFEGDIQQEREVVHGGTGWEELTFDFSGVTGVVPAVTFIFDITVAGDATNDPDNWTFYYDDVLLPTASTSEPPLGGLVSDFELNPSSYDFGPDGGFGGGAAAVEANPVPGGINTSDQVVRMLKFDADPFGGALWSMNSPLTVPNGSSFTMKVWSSRAVPVLFKLEGGTAAETTANHTGSGWELLTFDFPGIDSVYTGITVIFDDGTNGDAANDPANWTFYYDDITLIVDPDPDPLPMFPEVPLDFEGPPSTYDFGLEGGFGGGAAEVLANPVSEGINTSAQVVRMLKFEGDDFGGTTLFLPETLDVPVNSAFRVKVWSPRVVDVTFKLEGAGDDENANDVEVVQTHPGTGWEEMFFDFGAYTGDVTGITLIFDNGTVGDAGNDPDNWTFYFDDIVLTTSDDGPGGGLSQIDLPITFDDMTVDYSVIDFGDPVTTITTLIADPDDAANTVASTIKPAGTPVWAGTTMSTQAGLASAIPFSATTTTIGVRVYSPAAGLPVRLKADNEVDGDVSVEVEVMTTVANEWETLVFDFANQVDGTPALDLSTAYTALSIFFNFGTDGDTAGPLTFLWDDVTFGVPLPDETPPTLTLLSVASSNANPALAMVGDVVTVSMTANEAIEAPVVTIGGAAAENVTGVGASWQATRTLNSGDAQGVVAISVTATDIAGNEAEAVTMTTDASVVTLDSTAPTVSIDGAPASFSTLAPFGVTFQFSEAVSGFTVGDIVISGGAAGAFTAVDGDTYTANLTPNGASDLVVSVAAGAATDAAGNASEAAAAVTVLNNLDANAPLLTAIGIVSDNANAAFARTGDVVTISMTANEAIDPPTVTIAGAPADSVTGAGASWSASRTMLAGDPEGEIAFTINFQDLGGNVGPESTVTTDSSVVTFDITVPTLTVSGLPASIAIVQPIALSFDFDEDVSGFDVSDIAVTNGTADSFMTVDAATYTASVLPDGNGDLTVTVAAGAASDAAGNVNVEVAESALVDLQPVWNLVWSDDFEAGALDTSIWTARTDADCPVPCDEGQQSYTADRVTVTGGALTIEARGPMGAYTSGLVDTRGKRELRYGRVEIDALMPATTGAAPSLWMLPASDTYGGWPASGEIDIVNAPDLGVGNQTLEHALRYGLPVPEDTTTTVSLDAPMPADMTTLTYAIEWEAGEIRWFVNDTHVATQTQDNWYAYAEDDDGVYTLGEDGAPFDEDFYLVLSLAIGDNAGAGSTFPQFLAIDEVRVFECANALDPALGTGCSTGTGVAPVTAESEPYTESLEVYTDAPAVLDFVDSADPGNPVATALAPDTSAVGAGVTVNTNIAAADGANTVWNVDIAAAIGRGAVRMGAPDNASASGFFDLSGAQTAGELLFRMRVTSATPGTVLEAGLNGPSGAAGRTGVAYTADSTWRQYSVKIADVVTDSVMDGTTLNLANINKLFVLEARSGSITLDLDDIEVRVTCRDTGGCEATPRVPSISTIYGPQDFESIDIGATSIGDGWLYFNSVFNNGVFVFPYNGQAPNGPQMCALVTDEGGPTQGVQQFSVYSDYNCCQPAQGHFNPDGLVEVNIFQEPRGSAVGTQISADDVGDTWIFSFDAKRGNIGGSTEHIAFFKVLDPADNFSETALVSEDMTLTTVEWTRYNIELTIGDWEGQVLQFGFQTRASNFEPAGVFYDNIEVISLDGP